MKKDKIKTEEYINELEEKIIELSLRLKNKNNELNSLHKNNKQSIGKLVHNLKNPVGVIFSFSDMILEDVEDYPPEKLAKHMQIIKKSADFSIQLLNTIAKYSQVHSPDYTCTLKEVNYVELVKNIVSEYSFKAAEKGIKIEQDFPKTSILLMLDEEEISLAIQNILGNALRYSNENSTIKISIKENLNSIETVISDEGIGISEENLPLILDDFFVVNTYSEDKQKCIGLGLSIANKIIKQHRGEISVESVIEKGTSFKITFPKK